MQYDRMDFKSSPSLVSSKNSWVRVRDALLKQFDVADDSMSESKKKEAAAFA